MAMTIPSDSATTSRPHGRQASRTLAGGGWGVLLGLTILGALNHVLGVVTFAATGEEQMLFALFAGLDLYAVVVLLTAYRRHERWAWALTWVHTAVYALAVVFLGPGIGTIYLLVAGVSALAQLAALPSLRRDSFHQGK